MNKQWYFIALIAIISVGLITGSSGPINAQESTIPANPFVVPTLVMPDGIGSSGGQLTIDTIDNPRTFNPITQSEASSSAVTNLLNATLINTAGQGLVAESFEVSLDQTSVTLTIREGVKFSDGVELTASDVVFTLEDVVFDPFVNSTLADAWVVAGQFPTVEALDDRTVRISSPVAFSGLLSAIASTPIIPEHLLADEVAAGNFNNAWNIGTDPSQIAGLGPFRIQSFTPVQQVVLERNPYYWKVDEDGNQLPYLDRVSMPIISDDNVRLLRFSNGQSDVYPPRAEDVAVLRQQSAQGVTVDVLQAGTIDSNVITFNQDSDDPNLQAMFRDERFRQAMSLAANRASMISANLNSLGEPRYGPGISPTFWVGDEDGFPTFDFNLAQAAALLDQMGLAVGDDGMRVFDDGSPVEFTLLTVQGSTVLTNDAILFANDLEKIGIQVNVRPLELNSVIDQLVGSRPPQFDAVRITVTGGDGDPNLLRAVYQSTGSLHFWKYSDADGEDVAAWQQEVDQLLDQQAETLDLGTRFDLLGEFQRIVAENQPMIFLYDAQGLESFRSDRVGNFSGTIENTTLVNPEILFKL
jgi:peptide/nickel transport system substrate-binding protein